MYPLFSAHLRCPDTLENRTVLEIHDGDTMYVSCGNILRGQLQLACVRHSEPRDPDPSERVGRDNPRPDSGDPGPAGLPTVVRLGYQGAASIGPVAPALSSGRMLHRRASRTGPYDNELSRARLDRPPDHNLLRCHLHRT